MARRVSRRKPVNTTPPTPKKGNQQRRGPALRQPPPTCRISQPSWQKCGDHRRGDVARTDRQVDARPNDTRNNHLPSRAGGSGQGPRRGVEQEGQRAKAQLRRVRLLLQLATALGFTPESRARLWGSRKR